MSFAAGAAKSNRRCTVWREFATPAALALCYHVSARRLKRVPDDYAGCFACLADAGLVSTELSTRLQRMARFRNLLVHVYWEVDYGRVFDRRRCAHRPTVHRRSVRRSAAPSIPSDAGTS